MKTKMDVGFFSPANTDGTLEELYDLELIQRETDTKDRVERATLKDPSQATLPPLPGRIYADEELPGSVIVKTTMRSDRERQIMERLNTLQCSVFIRMHGGRPNKIVMEDAGNRVPIGQLTGDQVESLVFEFFAALYIARKELGFRHSDINGNNIMIERVSATERVYVIEGYQWVTRSPYMPRIIDFGKSGFAGEDVKVHQNSDIGHFGSLIRSWNRDINLDSLTEISSWISKKYSYPQINTKDQGTDYKAVHIILVQFLDKYNTFKRQKIICSVCKYQPAQHRWEGTNRYFCGEACSNKACEQE